MNREVVVRVGAVAAVLGGLLSFCVNASLLLPAAGADAIAWAVRPLLTLAGILTTFLYASGLVGLYVLVGRRS